VDLKALVEWTLTFNETVPTVNFPVKILAVDDNWDQSPFLDGMPNSLLVDELNLTLSWITTDSIPDVLVYVLVFVNEVQYRPILNQMI
jgi:hypothetical protein